MENLLSNSTIIFQTFFGFIDQRLKNILKEKFWFLQCQRPHFKEVSADSLKKNVKKMIEKNNEHIHVLGFILSFQILWLI